MSSHGAQPSANISSPLTEPAWWVFRIAETKTRVHTWDKTWMGARAQAAKFIGCHVDELELIGSPFMGTK